MNRGGRPRLPEGDTKTERRRAQYRASQVRKVERKRHDEGRCMRDAGFACPLALPRGTEPARPVVVWRDREPAYVTVILPDGKRVLYVRRAA